MKVGDGWASDGAGPGPAGVDLPREQTLTDPAPAAEAGGAGPGGETTPAPPPSLTKPGSTVRAPGLPSGTRNIWRAGPPQFASPSVWKHG